MIILVMGVSGSGKTTVGQNLAKRLDGEFIEGDSYHPKSNIDKMQCGIPLSDRDRSEWLERLSEVIIRCKQSDEQRPAVLSCSALKKSYRDKLREADSNLRLVYLHGTYNIVNPRLISRRNHFMSPHLLMSQLSTLEQPDEDESPIIADICANVDDIIDYVCSKLDESQYGSHNPYK